MDSPFFILNGGIKTMYFFKQFKNKSFKISSDLTWKWTWTLGLQIHWNWVTKKGDPYLDENRFSLDFHVLCFELGFGCWWE